MDIKVYIYLLCFCGISALSEENGEWDYSIGDSEGLHIRKKRVIGSRQIALQNAPYVINILADDVNRCTGSLLSSSYAITAEHCFDLPADAKYSMLSGSPKPNFGKSHNITEKITHPDYRSDAYPHDLTLVKFHPDVDFEQSRNHPIRLYNGPLPRNSHATIVSWGCHKIEGEERFFPEQLRSATVQIMSLQECRHQYRNGRISNIDHFICTYSENGKKRCDDGDSGAPLVVNGHLVGVMSFTAAIQNYHLPDMFVNLLHPDYRSWIARYVPNAV